MEDVVKLTYEQAVSVLPDGDMIHTYLSVPDILMGADWERKDLLDVIKVGCPEIGGDECRKENHGLIIFIGKETLGWDAEEPLFIETKDGAIDELEKEIKENG